jgi:segregation and condensation protein A
MIRPVSPARQDAVFVVELDRFHGPMDLLLHLIRQQDIDIFDIPIARITDQFLSAIREVEAGELDAAGEFLEMAATLVRIKAQLLLPRSEEEEHEDPRAELVRRLLEYEQIREVTHLLQRAEATRSRRFRKGFLEIRPGPPLEDTPLETTWEEVFQAAVSVSLPPAGPPVHRIVGRPVSMDEKVLLILSRVRGSEGGIEFRSLLDPFRERIHGVMTFLAGLELSRRRRILLRQTAPFRDLWLYPREEREDDEEDE